MYIFKNALRCITRSKARNILIGIIVFILAVSACIGLSIRQAAENAKKETLEGLSITATISFDRMNSMNNMRQPTEDGGRQNFDRDSFTQMMSGASALSLDEYIKYSQAETVEDFYYSADISVNGDDALSPVSNNEEETNSSTGSQGFPNMPDRNGKFGNRVFGASSDFTLTGYSNEKAMTDFVDGNAKITQGAIFEEGTTEFSCIISEELAIFNSLAVGDTINISNPNNSDEIYTFTVVGFYTDSSANQNSFSSMGMTVNDPANKIYTSYNVLSSILKQSEEVSETLTDSNSGREYNTALSQTLNATYTFADAENYEKFCEDVYTMGLSDSYTVSSEDIQNFENSLTPLTTLSKTAGYFLAVILIIGIIILVVLNIFNIRERKYEIGVLTAMGMKKTKVALQFITEIFIVTMLCMMLGAGIGAVSSVPVTNALLENQITAQQERLENVEQNFGRPTDINQGGGFNGGGMNMPENNMGGFGDFISGIPGGESINNYITEVSSATDLTVLMYMLLIAIGLTLVSGAASTLFIMRYSPLKILSNRD